MLIDTHSHLNFEDFKNDADEVIRRSLDGSTGSPQVWMINVGSQYSTSKRAVEMAEKYPTGVFAAIGLHPIHVNDEEIDAKKYKELAKSKKVVAIGEIGLDYKSEYITFKEKQKEVFLKQLDLAKELNLPAIIHCRMAQEDLIEILNYKLKTINYKLGGVIHCFTGTWMQAQKYLDIGFCLGFNGIIFKLKVDETLSHLASRPTSSSSPLDEVIEKAPLERILVETDCPYLTPAPMEGRNEPLYVKYVAEKIAQLKNLTLEEVAEATTQNAKKLFKI